MSYQGWANYETWAVNLWLNNEEQTQARWQRIAGQVWEDATETAVLTRSESARHTLADMLKEDIETAAPEVAGLYSDLLQSAIQEVNWAEIANGLLEECDGYEVATFAHERE